ncbi:MAG: long-chain-fatty-acid--CoA ligase [Gammaproteobacteria bacterium]|nr:long-chain-fatty-acid--CoA ligase [Pseudomonadales bacterium]MCP5331194.1 long-chain-fatty-acid--CoA ligase [Pseudomonadales bacterium]
MLGLMMDKQLNIADVLEYAALYNRDAEIVTRLVEGGIHRYSYADALVRSKQLANALRSLGVENGDRVATLAWNTHRHFELYYAVSGMGAVVHTINPRLFPEQIIYIINHAEDGIVFVDLTFVPLLEAVAAHIRGVRHIVVMTDAEHMPQSSLPGLLCYEDLLKEQSTEFAWPELDEKSAAGLCYTSGTTGNPKGVLYSHRSTVLHAIASCRASALNLGPMSRVLPVVPMFHVCAWGIPYAAPIAGASILFPGAGMDGASLHGLIDDEKATALLGVPTVWLGLLNYVESVGGHLDSVESVVIGGSAAPRSMLEKFQDQYGVFPIHAWGMTEMSPMGSLCAMTPYLRDADREARLRIQSKQGRPVYGVEMRIVDDEGKPLPHDGKTFGRLLVRGPWIASGYYRSDENAAFHDGWFDTGDVSTLDPEGYMQIVDRSKDVIKSGGEWISSIELENYAVGHPAVAEACVVGIAHPKWDERPLLLLVCKEGASSSKEAIIDYLSDKVAKWWLPDDVVFVDALPHTATGKLLKTEIRARYEQHYLAAG